MTVEVNQKVVIKIRPVGFMFDYQIRARTHSRVYHESLVLYESEQKAEEKARDFLKNVWPSLLEDEACK